MTGTHDDDAIGQAKGFVYVVGYEERRGLQLGDDAHEFALQCGAYDDVDGTKRLVHQQCARAACNRTRYADALRLAAG